MNNYIFYDFETTGRNSSWDQIIQIGAILTDSNLKEIDRFEARSKLKPGQIPYPKAILVNKSSVYDLTKSNLSNFELINKMKDKFQSWSPALFIGYNSIAFDENFLRESLFRNLYDPYLTVTNGNKRTDLLNIIRTNHIINPNIIKIPLNDKNKPSYKLDKIAPINKIDDFNAHDATGDSIATMKLTKIIKDKNPDLWFSCLLTAKREDTNKLLEDEKIVCITESYFGKTTPYIVSLLCYHPIYKSAQCFDLKNDPNDYINLTKDTLKHFVSKSPKIIRSLPTNKSPVIINKNYFSKINEYAHLSFEELEKRSKIILSNTEFKKNIEQILLHQAEEREEMSSQQDIYFEETIYKSFPTNNEKIIMQEFHEAKWENKLKIADKFNNTKYQYFAEQIIYEEHPNVLSKETFNKINRSISNKIFSTNKEKWNTIPNAYKEIDDLRNEYDNLNDQKTLRQLEELNFLIENIEKKFQDA